MNWEESVILELSQSMDIEPMGLGEHGIICFDFEQRGTYFIEQRPYGFLTYLYYPIEPYDRDQKALLVTQWADFTQTAPFNLLLGLTEDALIVGIATEMELWSRPQAEQGLRYLFTLKEKLDN